MQDMLDRLLTEAPIFSLFSVCFVVFPVWAIWRPKTAVSEDIGRLEIGKSQLFRASKLPKNSNGFVFGQKALPGGKTSAHSRSSAAGCFWWLGC